MYSPQFKFLNICKRKGERQGREGGRGGTKKKTHVFNKNCRFFQHISNHPQGACTVNNSIREKVLLFRGMPVTG